MRLRWKNNRISKRMKALETWHSGYRFRSRLEARWAKFYEVVERRYEYEKQGFELGNGICYLPDFHFPDDGWWNEIKGDNFTEEDGHKIAKLNEALYQRALSECGTQPANPLVALTLRRETGCFLTIGPPHVGPNGPDYEIIHYVVASDYSMGTGSNLWVDCPQCGKVTIGTRPFPIWEGDPYEFYCYGCKATVSYEGQLRDLVNSARLNRAYQEASQARFDGTDKPLNGSGHAGVQQHLLTDLFKP